MENVLTVKQAAKALQTSEAVMYKIIDSGQIRFMRLGRIKIRESEFDSFVQWLECKDMDTKTGEVTDQATGEVVTRFPEKVN